MFGSKKLKIRIHELEELNDSLMQSNLSLASKNDALKNRIAELEGRLAKAEGRIQEIKNLTNARVKKCRAKKKAEKASK